MSKFIFKYIGFISYVFWGICTTVVNIFSYYVCAYVMGFSIGVSTVIAWVLAVVFAYITNKLFVFHSKTWEKNVVLREVTTFFLCRALTGILDLAIMLIGVNVLHLWDMVIKVLANVIVIIVNYIASKLVIFKASE